MEYACHSTNSAVKIRDKALPLLDNDPSDGNVNTYLVCAQPSGIHILCEIGIGIPPEIQCSLVIYPSLWWSFPNLSISVIPGLLSYIKAIIGTIGLMWAGRFSCSIHLPKLLPSMVNWDELGIAKSRPQPSLKHLES